MDTLLRRRSDATPYAAHRDYVLSVLSRRCGWLASDEREETFHDAYAVLLEKQRDGALDVDSMAAHQVRAYLVQTAIHKALDEGKRAGRKRSVPLEDAALNAADGGRAPDDLAAAGMDGARVREIVAELPARRQAVIKLRFFFDRSPEEIQRILGISERAYRKELERAFRHLVDRYELVREGTFCDSRRSPIMAYVAGIAGPSRAQTAQEHLASCPSCAHWAAQLRELAREAGAVAPLPAFVAADGSGERVLQSLTELRELVGNVVTGAKQQATAVVVRVDPSSATYAPAARPGAVAAAVAGCIAVGSGATYCVVEGLPEPLQRLAGRPIVERVEKPRERPQRPSPAPSAAAAAPPVATPSRTTPAPAAPASQTATRPRSEPRRTAAKQPSPAAAAREFGIEGSGPAPISGGGGGGSTAAPAASSAPAAPSAPSTPSAPSAPAPPGEFDP